MKKKRRSCLLLWMIVMAMLILPLDVSAKGSEMTTGETIDFAQFLQNVEDSGYYYDGGGVTVQWSPSSACTDPRPVDQHFICKDLDEKLPEADGNNAQRIQGSSAQYQIFQGVQDVTIRNVNFVFEPADFTLCMNSDWRGSATKDQVRNAELQIQNSGTLTVEGCTFDQVIVSPYGNGSGGSAVQITGCTFADVYNAYAIKDVYASSADISGNTLTNCGGGIYFEGNGVKNSYKIQNNTFTNLDQYAAPGKEYTRGLIQFSAAGDYTGASITIAGNTSTGTAGALRQLNPTVTQKVLHLDEMKNGNSFAGELLTDSTYGNHTVYYNGSTYQTLVEALKAVDMSDPGQTLGEPAALFCKRGADVGTMTHGHVADDLIIYGNGAVVSGGEKDLEVDTYADYLDRDITIQVYDLNGIAVWGERHTEHTINIRMENCQNMHRIYITGTSGVNNIYLDGCSFDSAQGSHKDTAIYSNADGEIKVENTAFRNIDVGLNLNHKAGGTQTVTVQGCEFIDCGQGTESNKAYAAPIRIVAKEGARTDLIVRDVVFTRNSGVPECANGDILIGDGRATADKVQGTTTLAMSGTAATIMVQEQGYYGADGKPADTSQAATTEAEKDTVIRPSIDGHFIVCQHENVRHFEQVDATCMDDGTIEYWYCEVCGAYFKDGDLTQEISKEETILKARGSHNYVNGACVDCGEKDPNAKPTDPPKPGTGDEGEDGESGTSGTETGQTGTGGMTAPQTGDRASILMWGGWCFVSAAAIGGILITRAYRRKGNRR